MNYQIRNMFESCAKLSIIGCENCIVEMTEEQKNQLKEYCFQDNTDCELPTISHLQTSNEEIIDLSTMPIIYHEDTEEVENEKIMITSQKQQIQVEYLYNFQK